MPVQINDRQAQALARELGRAARNAPREIERAVVTMTRAAGTEAKRAAAAVYAVKSARIAQDIKVTRGNGRVTISGDPRPITALSYGAKATRKGLSFRVLKKGKRVVLRRGFLSKRRGLPLLRLSAKRLPVRFVKGPSVADMLANPAVGEPMVAAVTDRAIKDLTKRLGRIRGQS